jgi:hypothetical protein
LALRPEPPLRAIRRAAGGRVVSHGFDARLESGLIAARRYGTIVTGDSVVALLYAAWVPLLNFGPYIELMPEYR